MMERTQERAAAEMQAAHILSRMLSRISLEAGDKISISVTVSTPQGGVSTDRTTFHVAEQLRK